MDTHQVPQFVGFPPEAFTFLADLGANNSKEWFEDHRQTYVSAVQQPAVALVAALGQLLQEAYLSIAYDTRTNGSGSLMRVHRDTRFSADKSPYKTNIAMMFVPHGRKKMAAAGFGLQISTRGVETMAGVFRFAKEQLTIYRDKVVEKTSGAELAEAAAQVSAAGAYHLSGKSYKRVPRGYDAEHPRAEWLQYGGLYASAPMLPVDAAQDATLVAAIMTHFRAMAPLQQWLSQHVYADDR